MPLFSLILVILIGATAVVKGAVWFVEAAAWIARRTGFSELTVGATVVALATTLPEAVVSAYAAWAGHPGLSLGNALGSCLANGALILGAAALLGGFIAAGPDLGPYCLVLLGLLGKLAWLVRAGWLNRSGAALLLALGAITACQVWWWSSRHRTIPSPAPVEQGPAPAGQLLRFCLGAGLVGLGSRFLVVAAGQLAMLIGLEEAVIGLTVVSLGTSLPELATTVAAVVSKHQGLALGNLLGANLLNLTLVPGLAGLIRPLPVGPAARAVYLPLVASLTVLLLVFAVFRRGLGRPEGATLLVLYGLFLALALGLR